ncbi:MAG: hypothetical protein WD449_02085 [Candidatus Babeliales bacterium]
MNTLSKFILYCSILQFTFFSHTFNLFTSSKKAFYSSSRALQRNWKLSACTLIATVVYIALLKKNKGSKNSFSQSTQVLTNPNSPRTKNDSLTITKNETTAPLPDAFKFVEEYNKQFEQLNEQNSSKSDSDEEINFDDYVEQENEDSSIPEISSSSKTCRVKKKLFGKNENAALNPEAIALVAAQEQPMKILLPKQPQQKGGSPQANRLADCFATEYEDLLLKNEDKQLEIELETDEQLKIELETLKKQLTLL